MLSGILQDIGKCCGHCYSYPCVCTKCDDCGKSIHSWLAASKCTNHKHKAANWDNDYIAEQWPESAQPTEPQEYAPQYDHESEGKLYFPDIQSATDYRAFKRMFDYRIYSCGNDPGYVLQPK